MHRGPARGIPLTALRGLLLPPLLIVWWVLASASELVNSYLVPSPASVANTAVVLFKNGLLATHETTSIDIGAFVIGLAK
jgi:ABC-type nitrate/sulfonate/bicarbonate transport system permease component